MSPIGNWRNTRGAAWSPPTPKHSFDMTDETIGSWLKNFDDPVRKERIWKIGLLTGLRFDKERGYYPPNFERGLVLDRLIETRRPRHVLEIGTGRGLGSFALVNAAKTY